MNRKSGLFIAGFFTAVVTILVFTLTTSVFGKSTSASAQTADAPGPAAVAAQPVQGAASLWAEREAVLQERVGQGTAALESLDRVAQAQIGKFQSELADLEAEAIVKTTAVEGLQAELQRLQQAIAQDDMNHQDKLAALQAENIAQDALLRQQIDDMLVQLQGAYDEIAARQSSQSADSGQSQPSSSDNDHDDHDEHDDRDEHDEHDDRDEHDDDD